MKSQATQPVQMEFDFDELPKAEETKEEREKPVLPHFDTPASDNEKLLNYQYAYREQNDARALNQMYTLGYRIALKFINAKAKKNKHIAALCMNDREEKAHNAITYIIEQYIKRADFAINDSFTAYLYLRIQHELFYQRKVDKIVSFVDTETLYRGINDK